MPNVKTALEEGYRVIGSFTANNSLNNQLLNTNGFGYTETSPFVWHDGNKMATRTIPGDYVAGQTYAIYTLDPLNFDFLNLFNRNFSLSLNAIAPKAPNLKGLYLSINQINENISLAIASLTKLEVIYLANTGASLDSFSLLTNNLPNLRLLDLSNINIADDVINLPRRLGSLALAGLGVSGRIENLPDADAYILEYTSLTGKINDLVVADRSLVINLRLRGSMGIDKDWTGLNTFPNLLQLNLRDWQMSQTEVDSLLEYLYSNRTAFVQPTKSLNLFGNAAPSGTDGDLESSGSGFGWVAGLRNDGWSVQVGA